MSTSDPALVAETKSTNDPISARRKRDVESLLKIQPSRFELWKYFEERAAKLGERLWTIGVWLVTIVTATVSLPFVAKFIEFPTSGLAVKVTAPIPVALIAVFGMAFVVYSYQALSDVRDHIESNWARASYALTLEEAGASWSGRKDHGWNILLAVGGLAFLAFAGLLVLICIPTRFLFSA